MRAYLSLAALLVLATTLHANGLSLTPCTTDTLADYQSNFGVGSDTCSNGILNFNFFNFQVYDPSGGTPLGPSQIDLTPVGTPDQTGVTGFGITGRNNSPITAAPGQDVTYVIDWDFVIDSGPIAGGAHIGMDPPSGDITITQYYCLDSNFADGQTYDGSAPTCSESLEGTIPDVQTLTLSTLNPDDVCDEVDYCASITFDTPAQEYANVMTVIQIEGGTDGATFDSIDGDSQIDPATPEPGTLLLIPPALLFLFFIRRRALTQ